MSEAPPPSRSVRPLRLALLLGLPLLALVGVAWSSARSAARIWPPVDPPPLASLPPVLPACAGGEALLQGLLRAPLELDEGALARAFAEPGVVAPEGADPLPPSLELHHALDQLEGCGGLNLTAADTTGGPVLGGRLLSVARLRLLRAWERSGQGDLVGASADLVSTLRLGAILEHSGGDLALVEAGVDVGGLAVAQIELWLDANPQAQDDSLGPLAAGLAAVVDLPAGVPRALVRQCREGEIQLLNLGAIPAPAMLLEPAGVPLWVGWVAELLPGATVYDAPRTLAMHRQRCGRRLEEVQAGGLWDDADLGPALWDRERISLGPMLDNPLGRVTLQAEPLTARVNAVILVERSLRSRRALLATRVAVERGSQAHEGLLPLQLALLVPEFLATPPVDPVDGKPINWVRSHGEIFTTREVTGPDGQPQRLMTKVPER